MSDPSKYSSRIGRALKEAGLAAADGLKASQAAQVEDQAPLPKAESQPIASTEPGPNVVATIDNLQAGERKMAEKAAELEILEAEFGRICLDNKSYTIARQTNGEFTTHVRPGRHYVYPKSAKIANDLVTVATIDGIPFPSGGCVVLGPANVGKSPLLKYIQSHVKTSELIRFGEPLPGYLVNDADLAAAMLFSPSDMLLIDSFKNLAGRLSGGLFGTGLSREVFYQLQDWSSYFATMGRCFVTPLNISTENVDAVHMTVEALKSNCTMVITLSEDGSFTWLARTGENQPRSLGTGSIEWFPKGQGGIKRLKVIGEKTENRNTDALALAIGVGIDRPQALAASVRRFVTPSTNI